MKIGNEELQALLARQQTQQMRPSPARPAGEAGFGATLADAMEQSPPASPVSATPTVKQTGPVSRIVVPDAEATTTMQQALEHAENTLDLWSSYTDRLSHGDLRETYSLLQGLDEQTRALKKGTETLRGQDSGLDDLVNELSIMATTEKFKFNRGDYN